MNEIFDLYMLFSCYLTFFIVFALLIELESK